MTTLDLGWLRALPALLRGVPDAAALALGLAAGLALVLFIAFIPRVRSRPLPLLVLPLAPLLAACFGQIWIVSAASRPAAPLVERLESSGPALVQAHAVAAAGLALGGLILLVTALALAPRRPPAKRDESAASPAPSVAAAVLPLACFVLAVLLVGLAISLLAPALSDGAGAARFARGAAARLREIARVMKIAALVCAPLLVALGVVAWRSRGALRSLRREIAALALAAGAPALLSALVAVVAARAVAGLWSAALPDGFTAGRAPEGAPLCGDVDPERALFIGPSRLALGRRDLGAVADLDSDEGITAVVFAVDKAVGKNRLFIAADSQLRFAPIERLLRALSERQVRGAPPGLRRFMRRPRCEVVVLGASDGDASFPMCTEALLASADCPVSGPDDRTLLVLAGSDAYYHQVAVPFEIKRVPLHYSGPRDAPDAPYLPRVSRSLAALDEVPAQDVFELAVPETYRDRGQLLAPRFVTAARLPPPGPPLAPLARSPLLRMDTQIRGFTEPGMPTTMRDAVVAVKPALRACIERPDVKPGSTDVHLLVGAGGEVRRIFYQSPIPGDADCVLRTLAGLRFAPPRETVVAVEMEIAVGRARASFWIQPAPGLSYAEHRLAFDNLKKHEAEVLACYAPALQAGRAQMTLLAEVELDGSGTPSRVSIEALRDAEDHDLNREPELEACISAVLGKIALPVAASPRRRVHVRLTPP